MAYFVAENTGKGFITHQENETSHVSGWPANVWVTENRAWAERVGAVEKTKEEAQALIDLELQDKVYPEGHPNAGEPILITLP